MGWFIPVAAAIGSKLLGGLAGKKESGATTTRYAKPQYVNPQQATLLNQMLQRFAAGGGEFGYGPLAQQNMATTQAALAQRGIAPSSGVAGSAIANALAAAMAQDQQARRAYGLNLLTAAPPTWTPFANRQQTVKQGGSLLGGLAGALDLYGGFKFGQQRGWY